MKRQNNYRLLTARNGKVFNIFDFYYDGKRRRLYAESDTEIRETVRNFARDTTDRYKEELPTDAMLTNMVHFFIRGLDLFHTDIYDEECSIGTTSMSAFDVDHYYALERNIIKASGFDGNVKELTKEDFRSFFDTISNFFGYDTLEELDDLFRKTMRTINLLGVETMDYSTVELPKKYEGVTKNLLLKEVSSFNYFLRKDEYEELREFCINANYNVKGDLNRSHFKSNTDCIALMMFTGVAIDELLDLPYNRVDIQNRVLKLDDRDVPLDNDCIKWLKNVEFINQEIFAESEKLFGRTKTGKPKNTWNSTSSLRNIARHLGFPPITIKNIIRSFMIIQFDKGVPDEEVVANIKSSKQYDPALVRRLYIDFERDDFKKR